MSTTLLEGHVLSVLEGLPAGHFHTCVTSPPYWQLRAYGTPPQTWPDGWVGELGQEPTPEAFVAHLVAVFDAVKRVLRDDGSLWVNLAGSYWSEPGGQNGGARSINHGTGGSTLTGGNVKNTELHRISQKAMEANRENGRKQRGQHPVYKPLDWVDVPGLFARAMQAAGWLWRSDVVWVKPSALPESVQGTRWERCRVKGAKGTKSDDQHYEGAAYAAYTNPQSAGRGEKANLSAPYDAEWADCPGCPKCAQTDGLVLRRGSGRPTKSTERVLLFSKGPGYFYDLEATREPVSEASLQDGRTGRGERGTKGEYGAVDGNCGFNPSGRNGRDVWTIGPEPLRDSHYAAFPSELPSRCIRAGTSEWGCCPGCGAPWARVIRTTQEDTGRDVARQKYAGGRDERAGSWTATHTDVTHRVDTTLGWRPTCRCQPQQPPVPCRVLDPFGGSGTTALAANRLGRDCTLVELKPAYAALARKRVGREPLSLFATHGGDAAPTPAEEPLPEQTKQERHPNRTVAGFNQRWNASRRPVGSILPLEEQDGALVDG